MFSFLTVGAHTVESKVVEKKQLYPCVSLLGIKNVYHGFHSSLLKKPYISDWCCLETGHFAFGFACLAAKAERFCLHGTNKMCSNMLNVSSAMFEAHGQGRKTICFTRSSRCCHFHWTHTLCVWAESMLWSFTALFHPQLSFIVGLHGFLLHRRPNGTIST